MDFKKLLFCMFIAGFVSFGAFAQGGAVSKSKFYVLQVPIDKIYPHSKGYVVDYPRNGIGRSQMFLPADWFTRHNDTEGPLKGEFHQLGPGKVWPYVALFYADGVLDHVRVYVRREQWHRTWGAYIDDGTTGVDENFDNVENIKLKL
ncbi:MAG: hypothetical protein Ta2B_22780 [Termitinemataceae bacterium]|nr:MAG: hypothetical protein Ta2B_22780 [Termitinemataceae bacterium]